jgi:nucleoside-diphosphate-sugar epimerase
MAFPRVLRFDLVLNNSGCLGYTTGEVHLKSDGTAWRPIVHIEDISRAFIAVLKAPVEKFTTRHLMLAKPTRTFKYVKLLKLVAETVPDSQVKFAEGASPDKRSNRVNCDKIKAVIPDSHQ